MTTTASKTTTKAKARAKRVKDKYDRAIAYLTAQPNAIRDAWFRPTTHPAGCLFWYTGGAFTGGCLTEVRAGAQAPTPALTRAIRADERIPADGWDITVASLPAFAEWQRRLDRELGVHRDGHLKDGKGVAQ